MSMSHLPLTANIVLEQEYSPVKQVEEGEAAKNKDPREYCCCNKVHVQTASKSIAILAIFNYTLLLVAILIVDFVWNASTAIHTFNLAVIALEQSIYWSILLAQHKRVSRLYLPFLVVNGLSVVLEVVGLVVILGLLVQSNFYSHDLSSYILLDFNQTFLLCAFCLLCLMFNMWAQLVVYAAFQIMSRNQHSTQIHVTSDKTGGTEVLKQVQPIIMALA